MIVFHYFRDDRVVVEALFLQDYQLEAAISKVFASEAAWFVTDEAIQVKILFIRNESFLHSCLDNRNNTRTKSCIGVLNGETSNTRIPSSNPPVHNHFTHPLIFDRFSVWCLAYYYGIKISEDLDTGFYTSSTITPILGIPRRYGHNSRFLCWV